MAGCQGSGYDRLEDAKAIATNRNELHEHSDLEAIEVVRKMAGRWPDKEIASTLNRLHLKTASDQHWTQVRVRALGHRHGFAGFDPSAKGDTVVTLNTAATRLGVGA